MPIKFPIVFKVDKSGLKNAETGLKNFGKFAAGVAAATTAAIAGIAVKSVKEFATFDAALNQSIAIMGDVSETMRGEMSDAAREVAKTTTFSAEEAAESFFFLASAGLDAEASIAAMPSVAKFAQAGMFDMATATDLATDAQSALGLVSDDAAENLANLNKVTDVFVATNTLANTSVEQLASAFTSKAGNALKTLGKDVEEGAATLAVFADQGVKGERAGTLLTNTLFGLTDAADKNGDLMESMGISVFDAEGNMASMADIARDFEGVLGGMSTEQQVATLSQLGFTKQAREGILALVGQSDALDSYEGALRDAGGTVDEVSDKQLNTLSAQLDLAKSRFADIALEIGEQLAPSFLTFVEALAPVAEELGPILVEMFESLMPVIEAVIGALPFLIEVFIGLVTALTEQVIPALVGTFGFILDNIPTIATFVGVLGGLLIIFNAVRIATSLYAVAQGVLNAVLALNPFVLVAIAVAAVAAGIVFLATKTTFFQDTWQAVTEFAKKAWEGFGEVFSDTVKNIGDFFTGLVDNIKLGWQNTVEGVTGLLDTLKNTFETIFTTIGEFVSGIINGMIGNFERFVNGAINGINGLIRAINSVRLDIPATPFSSAMSIGFNIPTIPSIAIPRLGDGGLVMPKPGGVFANLAERGQPEVVIPLDRMAEFGGRGSTYNINVNAGMGSDGQRIGQQIVDEILKFERSSGKVFARA